MKYLKVITLFLLLIAVSCNKTEKTNCENFKSGKFVQNLEELGMKVYSERTEDGIQRDSAALGISKYKLTWTSECDLEAELLETNIEVSKKHVGRKYYVSILKKLSDTSYIYKCQVKENNFIDIDTIVKIN
jgi:hypothetical protein